MNGLLQSENVQMTIYGTSRLTKINGETIQIKRGFKDMHLIMEMFSSLTPKLRGNDIHLEYTYARFVRGKNVSIGPGCVIDAVEFENTFHQDTDAKVNHSEKIASSR